MESFNFSRNPTNLGGQDYDASKLPDPGSTEGVHFAGNWVRLMALFIDWVLPYLVMVRSYSTLALVVLILMGCNSIWLQGTTGASVGKMATGLKLAYVPTPLYKGTWEFKTPGVARCATRFVAHALDYICFIGVFKMLWNPYSRTLADAICQCVVIQDDRINLEGLR